MTRGWASVWSTVFVAITGISFMRGEYESAGIAAGFAVLCILMLREDDTHDENG